MERRAIWSLLAEHEVRLQSLQPFLDEAPDEQGRWRLLCDQGNEGLWRLRDAIADDATMLDGEESDWRWHCVANMLLTEIRCWDSHFVFYRTVDEQMVFYELHSYLLHHLYDGPRWWPHDPAALPMLVPCASVQEEEFPPSVGDVTRGLQEQTHYYQSDHDPLLRRLLLSCNLSLVPRDHNGSFHRVHYTREAHPLNFAEGYNGTYAGMNVVRETLAYVFGGADVDVDAVADAIERELVGPEYEAAAGPRGHALQICIPHDAVEQFAYAAIAYGQPALVYRDARRNNRLRMTTNPDKLGGAKPLTTREVLESNVIDQVQGRVVGHPLLFLQHGAYTVAQSGCEAYDRERVQAVLARVLGPLLPLARQLRFEHCPTWRRFD